MTRDKANSRFSIATIIAVAAVLLNVFQFVIAIDSRNKRDYLVKQLDSLSVEMKYNYQQLKDYQNKDTVNNNRH